MRDSTQCHHIDLWQALRNIYTSRLATVWYSVRRSWIFEISSPSIQKTKEFRMLSTTWYQEKYKEMIGFKYPTFKFPLYATVRLAFSFFFFFYKEKVFLFKTPKQGVECIYIAEEGYDSHSTNTWMTCVGCNDVNYSAFFLKKASITTVF
jgi:hypothetical protein